MKRFAVPILGVAILAVAACSDIQPSAPFDTSSTGPSAAPTTVTPSASNTTTSNDSITWNNERAPATRQARISAIQSDLAALGYSPGPIDGKVGPRTRAAVRKYQQDHQMKVDGRVTARLERALQTQRQAAKTSGT